MDSENREAEKVVELAAAKTEILKIQEDHRGNETLQRINALELNTADLELWRNVKEIVWAIDDDLFSTKEREADYFKKVDSLHVMVGEAKISGSGSSSDWFKAWLNNAFLTTLLSIREFPDEPAENLVVLKEMRNEYWKN